MAFDGLIRVQSASQAGILVEAANRFLETRDFEREISISEDHFYDKALCLLMTRLVQEGVTNKLVDDLNRETRNIRYRHIFNAFHRRTTIFGVYRRYTIIV